MKPHPQLLSATLVAGCSAAILAAGVTISDLRPGTLAQRIGNDKKYEISELKISGQLDADDIRFLRDMAGSDTSFKATPGRLVSIDLSEVSFLPDQRSFLTSKSRYKVTGEHSMPATMFYNCPITTLILPQQLDTIGRWALCNTKLSEISIPDGVVADGAVAGDSLLASLRLPDIHGQVPTPVQYALPALKNVRYGDADYVSSGAFVNCPDLEEIVFDGLIGHMDGYLIENCPKLKRVIFRGPIASTGGRQFIKDCPELEEVRFDGLIFASGFGEPINCPKLKEYTQTGKALFADSTIFKISSAEEVAADPEAAKQAHRLIEYKTRTLSDPSLSFLELIEFQNYDESVMLAEALGDKSFAEKFSEKIGPIKADMEKTKLQLLKEAPAYGNEGKDVKWSYAQASDSILKLDREYFNLDSIAGNGDDISRIKNLLYWVHDAVRHDGSSGNPDSKSLIDLYEICKKEDRGVNCRMMAIMLTEALLAEGIPARYLTCQPKLWAYDTDCHVICMAWSESLNKWIWVDPTFAAFVTDENGLLLHPGEVRERLIADLPLVLNPDANWNHKSTQTKEDYLDNYMAKNLYYIEAITDNRPRPEGTGATKSTYVLLAPEGATNLPGNNIVITDPSTFWARP